MPKQSRSTSATTQKSVQDAKRRLTRFLKSVQDVPQQELEHSAMMIYANATAQTPYKTGKLESSVYVKVSKSKVKPGINAGASAKSKSGYNYAGIQHENVKFHHPIKGKHHYISDPFNEEIKALKVRLRRKLSYKNGSR